MKKRSADWKTFTFWVIGLILAAVCLGWLLRIESDRQLEQSAEQSACIWAQFADRTIPDLDAVLAGGPITAATQDQLSRLMRTGDVIHFELLDSSGRQVWTSDQLGDAPSPLREVAKGGSRPGSSVETHVLNLGSVLGGLGGR